MKKLLLLMMLILSLSACKERLKPIQGYYTEFCIVEDGLLLPTTLQKDSIIQYVLGCTDTIYDVNHETFDRDKCMDSIFQLKTKNPKFQSIGGFYGGNNMNMYIIETKYKVDNKTPKDDILEDTWSIKSTKSFDTELLFKEDGIYMITKIPLRNAQINIKYENDIYNRSLGMFRDRNNVGLDFKNKQDNKYIYFLPYDKFIKGQTNNIKGVSVMYYP